MAQAQRLVRRSGTAGTHVTFWYSPAPRGSAKAQAEYFVQLLEKLHFVADLRSTAGILHHRTRTSRPSATPPRDPDRASGVGARLRFGLGLRRDPGGVRLVPDPNYGAFCDRDIDKMIGHAAQIPTEDPAASGRAWAKVDRAITDQAPFVSLVNPIDFDFVSERLGNYQYNPEWGLLLDIRAKLRQGIDAFIDAYVLSFEHGFQKPDPRMSTWPSMRTRRGGG